MDVASVTAVSAATAPSAAAPVSIDAMFGTMLQSVTDAEPSALPTPLVQSAALAMVLPGNLTGQQDTVTPGLGTPWLFAPVDSTAPATPVPGTSQSAPVNNTQQSASAAAQQSAAWLSGAATPVQTGATTENSGSSTPVVPTPASTVQPPVPQQATPASGQQTSAQQPSTQDPAPLPAAPEPAQIPVQTPSQTASSQTTSSPAQPAEQVPTPPSGALEVADQIVAPAPRDPVTAKVPKSKVAAEPQTQDPKSGDTTNTNTIVNVLAGFLLPQIEPTTVPANDATADTVDPAASAKSNDQGKPVVATADQNSAATAQPSPAAMVQPPAAPVAAPIQTNGQNATAAAGLPKTATPAAAAQGTGQDNAPTVAQKPATRQQAKTAAAGTEKQPVFVPANDTAPDRKLEIQPTADARTPATADSPQPVQASASTPAPHQAPAASQIANPAIIPVAPSGLRKLTAGLQVTAQEQDTRSSIDKLGLTIATKSIDGLRHFDIRLDPPELGRVQVQLTTDDAGRSQANVVVDKPHTLELLQRDAQSLNRALNDAGLDVSNNGLNFSLREQSRQNDGGADQGRGRSLSVQAVMQTDATHIHSSLGSYAPNSVRLDIRV